MRALILLSCLSLTLFSCTNNPRNLYGKWKVEHVHLRCADAQDFFDYLEMMRDDLDGAKFRFVDLGRKDDSGKFQYWNRANQCVGEWVFRSDSLLIRECQITDKNNEFEIVSLSRREMTLSRHTNTYGTTIFTSLTLRKLEDD